MGRNHPGGWKPGPNHETVKRAFYQMDGWRTVKQVQAFLNVKVDMGSLAADWRHQGGSTYWSQLAVQTPISDLLGIRMLDVMRPAKGRELLYRPAV